MAQFFEDFRGMAVDFIPPDFSTMWNGPHALSIKAGNPLADSDKYLEILPLEDGGYQRSAVKWDVGTTSGKTTVRLLLELNGSYSGPFLSGSGPVRFGYVNWWNSTNRLEKYEGGTDFEVATGAAQATGTLPQNCYLEMVRDGSLIEIRSWNFADSRPVVADVSYTDGDPLPVAGFFGISHLVNAREVMKVYEIAVGTDGESAPTSPAAPTGPAAQFYRSASTPDVLDDFVQRVGGTIPFSIVTEEGQPAIYGADSYSQGRTYQFVPAGIVTDAEVVMRAKTLPSSGGTIALAGALRASLTSDYGYVGGSKNNNDKGIEARPSGVLAQTGSAVARDVFHWSRFRVTGNQLKLKEWLGTPDDEPAIWNIEVTDSTITDAGFIGFHRHYFDTWITDFGVGINGDPAPTHLPSPYLANIVNREDTRDWTGNEWVYNNSVDVPINSKFLVVRFGFGGSISTPPTVTLGGQTLTPQGIKEDGNGKSSAIYTLANPPTGVVTLYLESSMVSMVTVVDSLTVVPLIRGFYSNSAYITSSGQLSLTATTEPEDIILDVFSGSGGAITDSTFFTTKEGGTLLPQVEKTRTSQTKAFGLSNTVQWTSGNDGFTCVASLVLTIPTSGPNTPTNLGFTNLLTDSVRFTWQQG